MNQKTGILAVLAIFSAIASYFLTFNDHKLWAIAAGALAVPLGIGGFIMAASPRVSGGIISIISVLLGVFAIGIAVIALVF